MNLRISQKDIAWQYSILIKRSSRILTNYNFMTRWSTNCIVNDERYREIRSKTRKGWVATTSKNCMVKLMDSILLRETKEDGVLIAWYIYTPTDFIFSLTRSSSSSLLFKHSVECLSYLDANSLQALQQLVKLSNWWNLSFLGCDIEEEIDFQK